MEKAFEIQLFLEVHTKQGLLMGGKKMGNRKWEHLIISPDYVPPVMDDERDDKGDIKTGRTLGQTYSSSDLFPDCKVNMSLSWFYEIPNKNPYVDEHVHDVDELVFFMPNYNGVGDDINAVWGEADFYIDGEPYNHKKYMYLLSRRSKTLSDRLQKNHPSPLLYDDSAHQ